MKNSFYEYLTETVIVPVFLIIGILFFMFIAIISLVEEGKFWDNFFRKIGKIIDVLRL
jgi:hypothetical protein